MLTTLSPEKSKSKPVPETKNTIDKNVKPKVARFKQRFLVREIASSAEYGLLAMTEKRIN
jgi:hypothetical protein